MLSRDHRAWSYAAGDWSGAPLLAIAQMNSIVLWGDFLLPAGQAGHRCQRPEFPHSLTHYIPVKYPAKSAEIAPSQVLPTFCTIAEDGGDWTGSARRRQRNNRWLAWAQGACRVAP